MGFRRGIIATVGLMLVLPPAWAFAADPPATRPAHTEDHSASPADELVPELDVNGMRLGDFATFLADQRKDVQIVQFKGPWQDLTIPSLHLRNVTRAQVMTLLGNMYPTLYVHPLDQHQGLFGGNNDQNGPSVWIFQQLPSSAPPLPTRVSAFGLAQTVNRLAFHKIATSGSGAKSLDKDAERRALKDVLSLIQATLDQSAEPEITPTVMLHEPTETILVKGTPSQISAVAEAIKALDTSIANSGADTILFRQKQENDTLKEQLRSAQEVQKKLEAQLKTMIEQQHKPGSKE